MSCLYKSTVRPVVFVDILLCVVVVQYHTSGTIGNDVFVKSTIRPVLYIYLLCGVEVQQIPYVRYFR